MFVKAAKGTRCPKEDKPREYVDDKDAVEVPDSAYYIRLVNDGSLKVIPAEAGIQEEEKGKKKSNK